MAAETKLGEWTTVADTQLAKSQEVFVFVR